MTQPGLSLNPQLVKVSTASLISEDDPTSRLVIMCMLVGLMIQTPRDLLLLSERTEN